MYWAAAIRGRSVLPLRLLSLLMWQKSRYRDLTSDAESDLVNVDFMQLKSLRFLADRAAKKWPRRGAGSPAHLTISVQWRSTRQTSRRSPRILQVPRLLLGNGIA